MPGSQMFAMEIAISVALHMILYEVVGDDLVAQKPSGWAGMIRLEAKILTGDPPGEPLGAEDIPPGSFRSRVDSF